MTGILEHSSGALTTLVMSFDTWARRVPHIEVYGDGGSLSLPDPNYFDGSVRPFTAGGDWEELPAWRATSTRAAATGSPTWP